MSTPILDPSLPADNSPLSSGEMRGQFQAIEDSFADIRARFLTLTPLGLTVSNPPTQADVQAIADKLDGLIKTTRSQSLTPACGGAKSQQSRRRKSSCP